MMRVIVMFLFIMFLFVMFLITEKVTAVTGVVVEGILGKWPDHEASVFEWTREEFADLVEDVKCPKNKLYGQICGLKTVIERGAPWSVLKFYIRKMRKICGPSKGEASD